MTKKKKDVGIFLSIKMESAKHDTVSTENFLFNFEKNNKDLNLQLVLNNCIHSNG